MSTIKNRVLRAITTMVLIAAMVVGMTAVLGGNTKAAGNSHVGEYKLHFNYNGVAPYSYDQWVGSGAYTSLPSAPSRSGYVFGGWKCGNTVYKAGQTIRVMGNMNFTAVWTCDVTVKIHVINLSIPNDPNWNLYPTNDYTITKKTTAKYQLDNVSSVISKVGGLPNYSSNTYDILKNYTYIGRKDSANVNESCSLSTPIKGDCTIYVTIIISRKK